MSAAETAPRKGGWARRWSRRWSRSREARWGVGLTSIWLVGFLAFAAVPLAMSVYISFTDWAPISGPFWDADTIGLKNYHTFLTDRVYWHSVFNTIYYAVGSVGVVNLVALPMALLLNQALRGLNFFRTVFYMPAILPAVGRSRLQADPFPGNRTRQLDTHQGRRSVRHQPGYVQPSRLA